MQADDGKDASSPSSLTAASGSQRCVACLVLIPRDWLVRFQHCQSAGLSRKDQWELGGKRNEPTHRWCSWGWSQSLPHWVNCPRQSSTKKSMVSQGVRNSPNTYANIDTNPLIYQPVGQSRLISMVRWFNYTYVPRWLTSHPSVDTARLEYTDVLVVREIDLWELVSPRIHASPPTLWTVLPTCLGTRLGSALKRRRPLVLRSWTVSRVNG